MYGNMSACSTSNPFALHNSASSELDSNFPCRNSSRFRSFQKLAATTAQIQHEPTVLKLLDVELGVAPDVLLRAAEALRKAQVIETEVPPLDSWLVRGRLHVHSRPEFAAG